ncbi:MAG: dynamin family protein, partial [Oscillospiraceae bacterium]|nr:dynamin family protein [Oscillospiraceae bacterium]
METYTDREEYIQKLESQMRSMDRILKMDTGTVLDAGMKKRLRELKAEAAAVLKKLRNDEFEIAIVGMEKAGKSTFANALMESKLLPAKGPRCTFTSTQIEYCGDGQEDSASVSFYSANTFDQDFKDKLRNLGFPDYAKYSFDTLDKSTYESIYASSVTEDKKAAYGESINKDILTITEHAESLAQLLGKPDLQFSSKRIRSGELVEYITDEIKARAAKQVVIRSSKLNKMKNAVIFDVPGFNSPTELHKAQTRERMKSADAIIIVANGALPSLTGESLKILNESDDEGNPLSDKLFVFANRIEDSKTASELAENIDSTYAEWFNQGFVLPSKKYRIVFGSALAHLQSIGLDEGHHSLSVFQEYESLLPHGDGIETIRTELENYNQTERLEVLKRRVQRIGMELMKMFSGLSGNYEEAAGAPCSYGPEHLEMVTSFCHDMPPKAEEGLLALKAEIQVYMLSQKLLSNQIKEYISESVTVEKYGISDALIKEVKLRTPFPGAFDDTARIEDTIRELKFAEMYDDFSKNVINIADKHHADYFIRIVDIIVTAMEIEPDSPYYSEMRSLLEKRLLAYRGELASPEKSQRVYYQSLVERFARDIYEVLITSQYNAERLRKFYDSIDNFFSMSVFYKTTDDLSYINIAPKEQPLCMMLLFHHYLHIDEKMKELSGELCKMAGVKELPEDMHKPLEKALMSVGGDLSELVERAKKKLARASDKSDDFRLSLLRNMLGEAVELGESYNIADQESFTRYYKNYHSSLRGGKQDSVEDFRQEFEKDIEILQDVLMNAFVRAINMETPFVARETKAIDDIIKFVKSTEFTRLLSENFWKIRYKETSRLDSHRREREKKFQFYKKP